ncbi:unnamed protein product [Kluyveromyces dobzhanskii CBS 2104]|uniref:diphosphoinositol-polyphosphate diphosphatase n=1 Tax=Kluyveromyces dobzhanskii CBS 2104 TaxID=1427455 RepID=A0A0A8L8R4_9SACH|nr:unnamed protein product [Kluyveromyces dobzhanskii CBS 2104]
MDRFKGRPKHRSKMDSNEVEKNAYLDNELALMDKLGMESKLVTDDLDTLLDNDKDLLIRVEELKAQFHDRAKTPFSTEEDADDIYDADEHGARSQQIISARSDAGNKEVIPPENFSHVCGEIYRSSFPRPENFTFLRDRLKLKSILVLIPEEYPAENMSFMEETGIELFQVGMSGNKEPFVNIPSDLLTKALEVVLNPANHPILIHCNRGKHRTGCLVGCIRKLQNWSLTMIFDEYRRFAFPKVRALDQQFIELYDDTGIIKLATENNWLSVEW